MKGHCVFVTVASIKWRGTRGDRVCGLSWPGETCIYIRTMLWLQRADLDWLDCIEFWWQWKPVGLLVMQ